MKDAIGIIALVVVASVTTLAIVLFLLVGWPTLPPDHEAEPGTLLHDMQQVNVAGRRAKTDILDALDRGTRRLWRWARGGAW